MTWMGYSTNYVHTQRNTLIAFLRSTSYTAFLGVGGRELALSLTELFLSFGDNQSIHSNNNYFIVRVNQNAGRMFKQYKTKNRFFFRLAGLETYKIFPLKIQYRKLTLEF